MREILDLLTRHGAPVVFIVSFLEQIGAPVPALPVIIVAGAVAATTGGSVLYLLALAVVGALIADTIWFFIGRRYGYGVLGTLCRISLSPDSCVRQTESFFEQWGLAALTFAKFIPGFSIVAPPLAGAARRSRFASFLLYDIIGALVWAGSALALGVIFRDAIDQLLDALARLGSQAVLIVVAALALFIAWKWFERHRFYRSLRMARISVDELRSRMDAGTPLVILDVRSAAAQKRHPQRIPGAVMVSDNTIEEKLRSIERDQEIILYCT